MTEPDRPPTAAKTLVMKLAEIMATVERVPKRGWNDFHKYHFATEADIEEALRSELATRHVLILPAITRHHREPVGEKGSVLTTLDMEFTFFDADSGEEITRPWAGAGTDKEDKGLYKAITGGQKYFLLKSFHVSTGDDPEHDGAQQNGAPPRQRRDKPAATVSDSEIGRPDRVTPPATDAEVDAAIPPYEAGEVIEDPRPRFRTGDLACPVCKRRVFKRKDGTAWFCWRQKGGCGGQWPDSAPAAQTASGAPVDTATGELEDDKPFLLGAVLRGIKGMTPDERGEFFTTFFDGKTPENGTRVQLHAAYQFLGDEAKVSQWKKSRAAR